MTSLRHSTICLLLPLLWLGSEAQPEASPRPSTPPRLPAVQTPEALAAEQRLIALAGRCPNGGPERQAALQAAVEADYPAAWRTHAALAAGVEKTVLAHALRLEEVRGAELVVSGRIARIETIQGGVIDYHTLLVHFDQPVFVRGGKEARAAFEASGTLAVLRGSSWDTWLAATLRRDLEQLTATRTFIFTRSELSHVGRPAGHDRSVVLLEYSTLPSAAAEVLR